MFGAGGDLTERLHYHAGDLAGAALHGGPKTLIPGNAIFYLAVAVRLCGPVTEKLAEAGLMKEGEGRFRRVLAEKVKPKLALGGVAMDFRYSDYFDAASSTGYEMLPRELVMDDATLFQQAEMVEAGWAAVQPILELCKSGQAGVSRYEAGSHGPAPGDRVLDRDGRRWFRLP